MNRVNRFERRDWAAAAAFFAGSVALAIPFRSRIAYHWDSGEFALAVKQYSVALSQPHAPGYFLYVMLGRLVNHFMGDPNASLVWLSVMAGGALAAALYLMGTAMFGRRTGMAAGLFAMTSPQVWFHSCVALTYVVDGSLVCWTVLLCWYAMEEGGSWGAAVGIGAAIAVVGGVRQQTVPSLAPLVLFTFWNFRGARVAKLAAACVVAVLLGLAWFVPMVKLSGGLPLYLEIVRRHAAFNSQVTALRGGWTAVQWNLFFTGLFCGNGLMLGALLLAGGLTYRIVRLDAARKQAWDKEHARGLAVLAWWIAPMMLVGIVGFTKQPGYVLSYLPGLLLLAAVVAAQLKKPGAFVAVTVAVCAVNAATFLAWPPAWDHAFFGLGRTAREIRQHDEQMEKMVRVIRANYAPTEAIICHAQEYLLVGLRQFELYLPEFDQYQLVLDSAMVTPAGKPMMSVKNGQLEFVSGIERDDKRLALLIVPRGLKPDIFQPYFDSTGAQEVPGSDGTLYVLPLAILQQK